MLEKAAGASLKVKLGLHTSVLGSSYRVMLGTTWTMWGKDLEHTVWTLGDINDYDNGLISYEEMYIHILITLGIPVINCFKPPMHIIVPSS